MKILNITDELLKNLGTIPFKLMIIQILLLEFLINLKDNLKKLIILTIWKDLKNIIMILWYIILITDLWIIYL